MPILKRDDLPTMLAKFRLDEPMEAPAVALPGRIPGTNVRRQTVGVDEQPAPRQRVLRGTHLGARTVELEVFTPDADFALPPVEEAPPPPEPEVPFEERLAAALAEQAAAFEARLSAEVAAAHARGYAEGEAAAREALEADYAAAIAAYGGDLSRIETIWRDFIEAAEPLLAALAFEVAEAILAAPLPAPLKTVAERTLTDAVEALAASAPLEVTLHPVDLLRLQESGVVEHLDRLHPDLRWTPNPNFIQGDWVAQAPDAAFRRLQRELVDTLKGRLGVATADSADDQPA